MTTTTWNPRDLAVIAAADELRIASERSDGTLRPDIPIWHAVVGDALFVRSARGPENGRFRRAKAAAVGRVSVGGVTVDVTFEPADPGVRDALDAALHAKYDRYGPGPVGAITGDDVLETTLRVMPRS